MAKEKTKVELAEERGQLYKKGVELVSKAKEEKRELSKEEPDYRDSAPYDRNQSGTGTA